MGDRRRKEEQKAAAAAQPKASGRQTTSFVNGSGIDREVITTDIYRYLGNDALVKPGTYQDTEGYFITAYRPLTSEQLRDIKNDSAKWQEEKRRNRGPTGGYDSSDTRIKIWGEADTRQPPPTTYLPPNPQMSYQSQIPTQGQSVNRGYDQYQTPNQTTQPGSYRPPLPTSYNTAPDPGYVTYSPPIATHAYGTMDRDPSQRMDEPRSMNPPYAGPPPNQSLQQSYPPSGGRGAPQYYSSTGLAPGVSQQVYQEPSRDYQYGRAPGPERQTYDFTDRDEEMDYDTPATSGANPPAAAPQPRPTEGTRKRTHEDRHRRHQ